MKYDMSIHTNPDASAWVKFFRECNPGCNVPDDMMLGWFSNAMMAMHDHLKGGSIQNGDHAQHLIDTARREALEEAARVAKSGWLTCPYGEIADAETMSELCEHVEAAIRALMEKE